MYKAIFLDLDNTIFSFDHMYERASFQAVQEVIGLNQLGVDFDTFYRKFREIADSLYFQYEEGKRTMESYQDERWKQTVEYFRVPIKTSTIEELNDFIHQNYLDFVVPFSGAEDFLNKLRHSHRVGLITNGPVEMQMSKLIKMNFLDFFDPELIIISEQIGVSKPHPDIFKAALSRAGIEASGSLHIGDSVKHDIIGANLVGMDSALIHDKAHNHQATPTYRFQDFNEATEVLLE